MSCSLIGKTLLFGGSYCKFESCQLNSIFKLLTIHTNNNFFILIESVTQR
jgi:hypothetical protein